MKNKIQKIWKVLSTKDFNSENFEQIKQITKNDLLTQILISRGINTPQKAIEFLNPEKMEFSSPFDFTDMELAVERILNAVKNQEFILIHGDFDADGITSTALLSKLLTLLKANFDIYIPNRETENHGLSTKAILKKKAKNNLKLIITCDCATSNIKEVQLLKSLGIETIITDHHEAGDILPDAFAIINPKVQNKLKNDLSTDKIKHLTDLAGVGVAFKLACAILEKTKNYDFVNKLLPLVAVGTISDVVPVLGENRAFIKMGLDAIKNGENKGLYELLKKAGINPENEIKAENIAFQITPRLNATSRLETADDGYKILISDNLNEIEFLCENLNNKNSIRQTLCEKIFKEAVEMYETSDEKDENAIILYKEDWHIGIIGIVASKLVERYNKPVFMMSKDSNSEIIRSSVRSIDSIHIYEILDQIKEYFISFGGHKGAAGLSFNPNEISFDNIKQKIFALIKEYSTNIDLSPILKIDFNIDYKDLTLDLIEKLNLLEPYGAQNPYPVFSINNLIFQEQKLIGQKQNHLKFICKTPENNTFECVFWNNNLFDISNNSNIDIAFFPKINCFNNNNFIQLDIKDARFQKIHKINIYDHRKKKNILSQVNDFVNKNTEKISIYTKSQTIKQELLKKGFPEKTFIIKEKPQHLMFFEYPENKIAFKNIINTIQPQNIHLMLSKLENTNINDFIGKILGMVKYATFNKNGDFDIKSAAKNINSDTKMIELILELLLEAKAIKINSFVNNVYNLEYLKPISYKEIQETNNYEEINIEFKKRIKLQEEILYADENEIIKMIE